MLRIPRYEVLEISVIRWKGGRQRVSRIMLPCRAQVRIARKVSSVVVLQLKLISSIGGLAFRIDPGLRPEKEIVKTFGHVSQSYVTSGATRGYKGQLRS
jgi:hypothetical protein